MPQKSADAMEGSLHRVNTICKAISTVCKVVFAVWVIGWLFSVASVAYSLVNPSFFEETPTSGLSSLVLLILYGATLGSLVAILTKIFDATARDESPFSMIQVKRLRVISLLLLAYAVLETLLSLTPVSLQANLQSNILDAGYYSPSASITLDLAPILMGAVVLALSFVFEYGVLLQGEADDTV